MAEHYTGAMVGLCAMETDVKQVINAAGVSTSQYVPYMPCLTATKPLLGQAALQTEQAAGYLGRELGGGGPGAARQVGSPRL